MAGLVEVVVRGPWPAEAQQRGSAGGDIEGRRRCLRLLAFKTHGVRSNGIKGSPVGRFTLFFLVGFLAISASGIVDLVAPEPCSFTEPLSSAPDGTCPPTCARCHCAIAFDLVVLLEVGDALPLSPEWLAPAGVIPLSSPADILHVPKLTLG